MRRRTRSSPSSEAVALGADALEFDLRVSRDGQLVVFHDPTLERTTDGRGPVAQRSVAELKRLDAGARFTRDGGRSFPWRGRGVTVSTFDEIVEALPRSLPLHHRAEDTGRHRSRCARRCGATTWPHASSSPASTRAYAAAARRRFRARRKHARRGGAAAAGAAALAGHAAPLQALCIPQRWHGLPVPIAALARTLRGSGAVIHVWTVNQPAEALQLWRDGVQGILSDDPALMLRRATLCSDRPHRGSAAGNRRMNTTTKDRAAWPAAAP